MNNPPVILQMRGITKRFGRLLANDSIDLELRQGEVLGLLGENGAGKTTLMSILFGHYVPDSGTITVMDKPLAQGDMRGAMRAGIGMVQQHFALAGNLSVYENIVAGSESLASIRFHNREAKEKIANWAQRCGFEVPLDANVNSLSVGERQKVEILKVLFQDAKILVLDEPTAVLTPQESEALFKTIHQLTKLGMSVILISHKLEEVIAASDRIAVLRSGKLTYSADTSDSDKNTIIEAMVGHEIIRKEKVDPNPGKTLLSVEELRLRKGSDATVNLQLREGEIIGITGVSGNGQSQLFDVLCGLGKIESGKVSWFEKDQLVQACDMEGHGIARIPDDRGRLGVVGDMSVAENMVSNRYRNYSSMGFMNWKKVRKDSEELVTRFNVVCDSTQGEARLLSGGNMQKLILARELSGNPKVILANQPTRGLDVGAIGEVHRLLLEAKERGAGVLLMTEDLDELFDLSDRIAVMFRGGLSEFHLASSVSVRQVGYMMSGSQQAT